MKNIEANKAIVKIQKDILKNGIIAEKLVKELKEIRELAKAEEDPTATKVLRLTYEHISEHGTFNIPIPNDEPLEDDEEVEVEQVDMDIFENKIESLNYLLSILLDRDNIVNQEDLKSYRNALLDY